MCFNIRNFVKLANHWMTYIWHKYNFGHWYTFTSFHISYQKCKVSWQQLLALYKITCLNHWSNQNKFVMKVVFIFLKLLNRSIFLWIQLMVKIRNFQFLKVSFTFLLRHMRTMVNSWFIAKVVLRYVWIRTLKFKFLMDSNIQCMRKQYYIVFYVVDF